jgi:hypothetical protein
MRDGIHACFDECAGGLFWSGPEQGAVFVFSGIENHAGYDRRNSIAAFPSQIPLPPFLFSRLPAKKFGDLVCISLGSLRIQSSYLNKNRLPNDAVATNFFVATLAFAA